MSITEIETAMNAQPCRTKEEWQALRSAIRASLHLSIAHLVRWNLSWCNSLDVAETLARRF